MMILQTHQTRGHELQVGTLSFEDGRLLVEFLPGMELEFDEIFKVFGQPAIQILTTDVETGKIRRFAILHFAIRNEGPEYE